MKQTLLAPVTIFLGFIGSMLVMAESNLFTPIVQFIHSGNITALQAIFCLLFTAAGFAACYYLLNILCSYFVPRMETGDRECPQTKDNGGIRENLTKRI